MVKLVTQIVSNNAGLVSTLCLKKCHTFNIVHIFADYQPIFKIFFTGTLSIQLAIKRISSIPPHLNFVTTLPCEI